MADIELVIKIPDYYLENIKKNLPIYLAEEHITKILPKGHGRLKDVDAGLKNCIDTHEIKYWDEEVPTIIEGEAHEKI